MIEIKTYVINLASCEDRRKRMIVECSKYFKDFEIFNAIDGRELQKPKDKMKHVTVGIYGNLLSHKKIVEKAKELGLEQIIVLEDDCEFHSERMNDFYYYISKAPKDWEIISLGMMCFNEEFIEINENYVKPVKRCYGTHAYIINKNGYDKFLSICNKEEDALDSMLTLYSNEINYYFVMPSIVKQLERQYSMTSYNFIDFSGRFKYF